MFRNRTQRKNAEQELKKSTIMEAYARQLRGERLTRAERKLLDQPHGEELEDMQRILSMVHRNHAQFSKIQPRPGALQRVETALMDAIHHGRPVALPQFGAPRTAYSREPMGSDSELIQTEYDIEDASPGDVGCPVDVTIRILEDGVVTEERLVEIPAVVAGRGDEAALQLTASGSISRRHIQFSSVGGSVYVQDLQSRNGTYVNGNLVQGRCPLHRDDSIKIGEITMEVVAIGPHEQGVQMSINEIRDGESVGEHALVLPQITLGRGSTACVQFSDPTRKLSRVHAQLDATDGTLYIVDLDSSNGTHVDGQRIHRRTRLQAGSLVQLGGVHLQIAVVHVREGA